MNITAELNEAKDASDAAMAESDVLWTQEDETLEESYLQYERLCEKTDVPAMSFQDWTAYQKHVKSPGTTLTPETFQRFQENSREDLEAMVKSLEDENVELITEIDRASVRDEAAEVNRRAMSAEIQRLKEELEVTTDWLDKNKVENAALKQELNESKGVYHKTPENQPLFPHYFVEVPLDTTHVDVYWFLKAWQVYDPCVQHAVKKLLAAGRRGAKDVEKDLREARDSITRALELENTK
jgi:hypothetical protein